jgi:hypothetical protein
VFSSSSNDSPHDLAAACRPSAGCFGLLICSITTHGRDAAVSLCVHPVLRPQCRSAIGKAEVLQNDDTKIFYHYNDGVSRNFIIFSEKSTNSSPLCGLSFSFYSNTSKKWAKMRERPPQKKKQLAKEQLLLRCVPGM